MADVEKKETSIEKLTRYLEAYHTDHFDGVKNIIDRLNNVSELSETSIRSLSLRHVINDRVREIDKVLTKYRKIMDAHFVTEYPNLKTHIRDSRDIKTHVEVKYPDIKTMIDMLVSEIKFAEDCVNTLISVDFSIKNRMSFERGYI
jgi:uncharacterized protein YacL